MMAAFLLGAALDSAPESACPDRGQIERALTEMGASPDPRTTATVSFASADVMRVEVRAGDRKLVRTLPVSADCERRARTVAVVVAAFEQELADVDLPNIEVPGVSAPSEARAPQFELGGAALVTTDGGGSPGGVVHVARTTRSVFSPIVRFGASRSHEVAIGRGAATWMRAFGSLGVRERVGDRWRLSFRQDALVVMTIGSGDGYDQNRASARVVPGLGAAVAVERWWNRASVWAEIGGTYLLADQQLVVDRGTSSPAYDLPRATALVALGTTWAW